jgi:thiosulfate dehydrogenase [quinone] large subunit
MKKILWLGLRLVMGFIFLWAFFDKLLGLGFATLSKNAWIHGGSPTAGFLLHATRGPWASFFQGLAGVVVVDWVFMMGLAFVGLTVTFNKYLKWGAWAGSLMLILMYLATFPPMANPVLDEHLVYILVLVLLCYKKNDR